MRSQQASRGTASDGSVDAPRVSLQEAERLLAVARRSFEPSGDPQGMEGAKREENEPLIEVVVGVFEHYAQRVAARGRGASLETAVGDGARRAGQHLAVTREEWSGMADLGFELWLPTGRERLRGRHELVRIQLGVDGVELQVAARTAMCLPSAAIVRHIRDRHRLMTALAHEAGIPGGAWRRPAAIYWRTTWDHYVELPRIRKTVRLRGLRPTGRSNVDRATVLDGLERAQSRLLRVQDAAGLYAYRYRPFHNRVLPGSPNLVRQAGCAYAISRSATRESSALRGKQLADSASRALGWLFERARLTPAGEMEFDEEQPAPRRAKLGTTALALLALQHGALSERHPSERSALRAGVLGRRAPDGSFRCFADSTSPTDDGASQNYFPGEALLALAHAACRGDATAEAAAADSFAFYRAYFRRSPALAFAGWHAAAWRVLFEHDTGRAGSGKYAQFVLEIVDWLIRHQLDEHSATRPELIGGFAGGGGIPGCSTATYTEAVIHGYAVAQLLDDGERVARYRESARRGLGFILGLQVTQESAMLCPDPSRVAGATTRSGHDFLLRSDFDQHTITAFLAATAVRDLFG
jgi:hypothetical protein